MREVFYAGKTKKFYVSKTDPSLLDVEVLDVLTYGDGVYIYPIQEVGELKTKQIIATNNLFQENGIKTSITGAIEGGYTTEKMEALPLEVVFRYGITGSAVKRYPQYNDGDVPEGKTPMLEVFFKDAVVVKSDGSMELMPESESVDYPDAKFEKEDTTYYEDGKYRSGRYTDPYLHLVENEAGEYDWFLYPNKGEFNSTNPPLMQIDAQVDKETIENMLKLSLRPAEVLKARFESNGGELIDGKFEYGKNSDGELVLLEAITLDEVRSKYDGRQRSKQVFRDIIEAKIQEIKDEFSSEPESQETMWANTSNQDKAKCVFAAFTDEDNAKIIDVYRKGLQMVSRPGVRTMVSEEPGVVPKNT